LFLMPSVEFYFSLPRLLARWTGRGVDRTERNWLEANLVGSLVHLVAYGYAFHLLLADARLRQQLFLFIPLAFLVWIWWLIVLYLNSLIIKFLRACGLMKTMLDRRGQSLLICVMTTIFALQLLRAGSWLSLIGGLWIAAVMLNLLAALVLAVSDTRHAAPN
jgi:hypothetical protein